MKTTGQIMMNRHCSSLSLLLFLLLLRIFLAQVERGMSNGFHPSPLSPLPLSFILRRAVPGQKSSLMPPLLRLPSHLLSPLLQQQHPSCLPVPSILTFFSSPHSLLAGVHCF